MLALVLAVTGCAGSRSPRPPDRQTMSTTAAAQALLTTDAASLHMKWYLSSAEYQLTTECMKDHGFAYVAPDPGPEPSPATITAYALGTGHPATYGITPATFTDPPRQPDGNRPGFDLALDGPSTQMATVSFEGSGNISYETGGCTSAARTRLYGSIRAYVVAFYLPQIETSLFREFTGTDQPYLSALASWQACMKADAFPYANPDDASGAVQQLAAQKVDPTELRSRQTAIAEADTACDARSHLRQRTIAALGKFVRSRTPALLGQLADLSRTEAGAYRSAQQLISP